MVLLSLLWKCLILFINIFCKLDCIRMDWTGHGVFMNDVNMLETCKYLITAHGTVGKSYTQYEPLCFSLFSIFLVSLFFVFRVFFLHVYGLAFFSHLMLGKYHSNHYYIRFSHLSYFFRRVHFSARPGFCCCFCFCWSLCSLHRFINYWYCLSTCVHYYLNYKQKEFISNVEICIFSIRQAFYCMF